MARLVRVSSLATLTILIGFAQTSPLNIAISPNVTIGLGVPANIRWNLTGGVAPYRTVLMNPEALPIGLTFNGDDTEITGTPTMLGTSTVTLSATDAQGNSGSATVTITVAPPVSVPATTLPPAVQGQPYAFQLTAMNGAPPYTWALGGGALPPGFRIDTRGIVGGVASGSGTFTFSVQATDSQGSVAQQSLTIQVMAPPPTATVASVVNAASGRAGLAPGAYASIFGANLATSTAAASGIPFPDTLAGVNVTLNGVRVPLLSVSGNQINFQVPFSIAPGKASLVVNTGGTSTPAMQVDIVAAAPGIFQTPDGRALALNEDASINSPSRSARAGTIVVLFATGAGAFDPALGTGGAAPSGSLVRLTPLPVVTIGGKTADVLFAGAAPGQASGLLQVNARVPALTTGDYPVTITVNGQISNSTLLSVTAP